MHEPTSSGPLWDDDDPWTLPEPEPTALVALWPAERPEAADVIGRWAEARVLAEPEAPDSSVWCSVVEVPQLPPVLVWCEPAKPLDPGELDEPRAAACRWVVGAQTVLDPDDALAGFVALLRLLAEPFADVPAVLDANSGQWHTRRSIEETLGGVAGPPANILWTVHIVDSGDERGAWIHTHGLWRCGRPELEMLAVPGRSIEPAAELIDTIAGRLLEVPVPSPDDVLEVGPGLEITLQPWQVVAPFVGDAPGGAADRGDAPDDPHAGVRGVVCATHPQGAYRKVWTWPREVIESIERGERGYFLSVHETQRRALLAQAGWDDLRTAFGVLSPPLLTTDPGDEAGIDDRHVRFLIEAAIESADGDDREHLWFVVKRFDDGGVEAVLLNRAPPAAGIEPGRVTHIERGLVSDWSVVTPLGMFGPEDAESMREALAALTAREGTAQ